MQRKESTVGISTVNSYQLKFSLLPNVSLLARQNLEIFRKQMLPFPGKVILCMDGCRVLHFIMLCKIVYFSLGMCNLLVSCYKCISDVILICTRMWTMPEPKDIIRTTTGTEENKMKLVASDCNLRTVSILTFLPFFVNSSFLTNQLVLGHSTCYDIVLLPQDYKDSVIIMYA